MRGLPERGSGFVVIEGVNEGQSLVEKLLRERGVGPGGNGMMQVADAIEQRLVGRVNGYLQVICLGASKIARREEEQHGCDCEKDWSIHHGMNRKEAGVTK